MSQVSQALTDTAIKAIAELTEKGVRKTIEQIALKGDSLNRYLLVKPDGTFTIETPPPTLHFEKLDSVVDLIKFIDDGKGGDDSGAAYVSKDAIDFVYDQAKRTDRTTVLLTPTEAWRWLTGIESGHTTSQRDLIRALRVTLDGCLPAESNLLSIVRNLKFVQANDGGSNIQHGRESIGRSIVAETRGEVALPEFFTLHVELFEQHRFSVPIKVYLEPEPGTQSFFVRPFPSTMLAARDSTLQNIQECIAASCPTYLGCPF